MTTETEMKHRAMVEKLAKPGSQIMESMTATKLHLIHMSMGIDGEIAELDEAFENGGEAMLKLDRDNLKEELGDLLFYVEGVIAPLDLRGAINVKYGEGEALALNNWMLRKHRIALGIAGGHLTDAIKKHTIYNQPLDYGRVGDCCSRILWAASYIMSFMQFSLFDVLNANIEKLAKRYPDFDYSDEAAKVRADKADEVTRA